MRKEPYFMNEKLAAFREIKSEFKAETKGDEAVIYIYGGIGQSHFGESVSADNVRDLLNETNAKTIHVRINTVGGDVFHGLAIYNLLKDHDANIIIHIDGLAASAGSIIAMAGDEIRMPKTSMMMIHNAWTVAGGNAKEMLKVAEDLAKINDTIIEAYLPRFVGTREELVQLLDDETFLTADEAVTFGLADIEVEESEEVEEAEEEPILNNLLAKYSAKVKTEITQTQATIDTEKKKENKTIFSKFKAQL